MPIVTVLPNEKICPEGAQVEVKTGEKLAQALNKAGVALDRKSVGRERVC